MLDPSDKNLSLFPIDGWLSNCKLAQETSIMPDPYVSGYMNMPNLGSQSSMKACICPVYAISSCFYRVEFSCLEDMLCCFKDPHLKVKYPTSDHMKIESHQVKFVNMLSYMNYYKGWTANPQSTNSTELI